MSGYTVFYNASDEGRGENPLNLKVYQPGTWERTALFILYFPGLPLVPLRKSARLPAAKLPEIKGSTR